MNELTGNMFENLRRFYYLVEQLKTSGISPKDYETFKNLAKALGKEKEFDELIQKYHKPNSPEHLASNSPFKP